MDGEEVLVRRRGEGERVVLLRLDGGAGEPDPLAREYLKRIKLKTYLSC